MEPRAQLDGLIGGFRVSQAIRAAAWWRVADALAAGPASADAVAAGVGADPSLVHRLLRFLAAVGVTVELADDRFANSPLGELLRTDVPGSLHAAAIGRTQDGWWSAWSQLSPSLAGGSVPYDVAHGESFWAGLRRDPEAAVVFDDLMTSKTSAFVPELIRAYDFSSARLVVDVGGGSGALLGGILAAAPQARGIVADLPGGLAAATRTLAALGVADRCRPVVADFFVEVPTGGDVYILRQILHDWPDDRSAQLLAVCRRAMQPDARLLVIDQLLPEHATEDPDARLAFELDLQMFVLFGAGERTRAELVGLTEAAGFRVDAVLPTTPERTLVATAV